MRIRHLRSIHEVEAPAWDALVGDDDPFVEHAFLACLEDSGSVGPGTGWSPRHVTAWEGDVLCAALPLYEKDHSYGEYIFDWAWASAAARAGISYYPKLVSMVPFTPATGRRLLLAEGHDPLVLVRALVTGALEALQAIDGSSLHLLFLTEDEMRWATGDGRLAPRLSHQFHWRNEGYAGFDDFLGRFRSSMRKKVLKERRVVDTSGLSVRVLTGEALDASHVAALGAFYRDTCERKGSYPYLTDAFFELVVRRLPERVVVAMAFDEGARPLAASLNFEKGQHLYGRYWGARAEADMLHFELCYYRLIERAIDRKLARFEAGAQGTHKLRRGLMPVEIHSAHLIRHPALRDAVEDFLPREAEGVRREMAALAEHGPFRREEGTE